MYQILYRKVKESSGNNHMPTQMTMNFEPVHHKQWETCREYIDDKVIPDYLQERGILKKYLAADLELSPSELRRKLCPAPGDTRNFNLDDLENWLETTRDMRPVFYLLEKYSIDGADELARLKARVEELESEKICRAMG